MVEIFDHAGRPATHGRARVNGIRMHYVTAGSGPALLLYQSSAPKFSSDAGIRWRSRPSIALRPC